MKKNRLILIDQYHIDIKSTEKLTKDELEEINMAFKDPEWIGMFLRFQFSTKLRNKLKIELTQ